MIRSVTALIFLFFVSQGYPSQKSKNHEQGQSANAERILIIEQDKNAETISVFRAGEKEPVLTQNAKADFRPYIHPIVAPDGKGVLTEYSPEHHKHQTGLYWGFSRVNGRDYFIHPQSDYWQRVSAEVIKGKGQEVKWQTVYNLLDENGHPILTETQSWSMREEDGKFLLNLEWRGKAKTDITFGEYPYGGLFLRMPWRKGISGEVTNSSLLKDERAEGERATWIDVGMQVEGRDDMAHIAIFDHPDNKGFPQPWRVDDQMGIGPARSRLGDWKMNKGETEIIRHQLVVYTGDLDAEELNETWGEFTGQHPWLATTALWDLARKKGREAKFLTPKEAAKSMTLIDGFKVNVWASEPMIAQPMAFCWDSRGRLWIVENRDYESRGEGFSNSGDSRILILEDTDGDGVADSRKVFMEGLVFPTAIAVGFDGVFVGAPPNLLFIPDRNHDDKADIEDIEVRLTGWGIRDRHEVMNSLHWGPDGWLYGLQGFATSSNVRKPKGEGRLYSHTDPFPEGILEGEGVKINGGVWRYHPIKDRFEVVAHGFSNPWGIDYNAKGQLFISACVIPHLWHVIPGGIYHRQGGQHFNPYVYNDIKTIADHRHQSAHGGARVYLSDAFPESQYGRIFMANIHEHAVLSDVLEPKGSGYTAHHGEDFLMANNAQWIGFSLQIGPEGALYVLDWHDASICGDDVLNKETGRIFRITPKKSQAEDWKGRYADLTKMTDKQLVDIQTRNSAWHARRARLILQKRASKDKLADNTHEELRKIFQSNPNPDWRLRAMWALHVTGGFNDHSLIKVLNDKNEYIRAWAIQLLCEDYTPSPKAVAKFIRMARKDPSPVVRLYLASALQRLDHDLRWKIAGELMLHEKDADDHNLPKMIWFGIEPLVAENPGRALELVAQCKIPMVTQFIARRAVDAGANEALVASIGRTSKPQQISLLEGMRDGLEGRSDPTAPPNWASVYAKLRQSNGSAAQLALELAQQFGSTEAAKQYLTILTDKNAPPEKRRKALHNLADQHRPELIKELPVLLDNPDLRTGAIRAIAGFDNEALGKILIEKYDEFNTAEKTEVIQTLASRPKYGRLLTRALKNNIIPQSDVPAYAARQLRRVAGNGFVDVWGPIGQSASVEKLYPKYRRLLTDKAISGANVSKGRLIFQHTCGSCHTMYGEGGDIGPNLTGSNRTNPDYLLFNILEPNAEIQDAYKMVVVTTRDGRTYSGNITVENERQVTLRVIGKEAVVIDKSEIQSREETSVSMMPPGLLKTLTDEEVLDLVAYLRTTEQVDLP